MRAGLFFSFWAYPLAALALWLATLGLRPEASAWSLLPWLPLGMLGWTLLEYSLHRFVFHWRPSNRRLRRFIAQLHLVHHGDTHDPEQILVRPRFSLPISALLFALFYAGAGWTPACGLLIGIWIGFLYYEAVHYRVHLSKRSGGLLQAQRRFHFIHHFIDEDSCFGVTTPLWDVLLGTFRKS